jgi:four helix bundle protein
MQPERNDLRQRTKDFGLHILRLFAVLPKSTEAQVLGKQLLRSGTSVGANDREAYRGRSKAEFVAKCGDSLRELEETAYCLNSSLMERLSRPKSSQLSDRNVTS